VIDDIFSDNKLEQVIGWFGESAGALFLEKVKDWLQISQKSLEQAEDLERVFRAQGQVQAYKSILNIPTECRKLKEDKRLGRRT
jgi:hypothetical protein